MITRAIPKSSIQIAAPRRSNIGKMNLASWREHFRTRGELLNEHWRLCRTKGGHHLRAVCRSRQGKLVVEVQCHPKTREPRGRITIWWVKQSTNRRIRLPKAVNSGCRSWRRNLIQLVNDALLPGGICQS